VQMHSRALLGGAGSRGVSGLQVWSMAAGRRARESGALVNRQRLIAEKRKAKGLAVGGGPPSHHPGHLPLLLIHFQRRPTWVCGVHPSARTTSPPSHGCSACATGDSGHRQSPTLRAEKTATRPEAATPTGMSNGAPKARGTGMGFLPGTQAPPMERSLKTKLKAAAAPRPKKKKPEDLRPAGARQGSSSERVGVCE
jgi:hypothetical protein